MDRVQQVEKKPYWWREGEGKKRACAVRPRPGQPCAHCRKGTLVYDGLFMLTCSACGFIAESGAFT